MTTNEGNAVAVRQIAILVGQEATEIAERIRGLQRIAMFNRDLIGGDLDRSLIDKMEVAERCIDDVRQSVRELLGAQIVALRSGRDAVDAMRVIARIERLDDESPRPIAGS